MKQVIKKRKEVIEYKVFQAVDGTEFKTEEECADYEASALGVLRGRLKEFIVDDEHTCWELMGGEEEHTCLVLTVPTKEAIHVILQNYYLDNPWILNTDMNARKQKVEKAVQQAYKDKDIIFFGLNCDRNLYLINTRRNIVNNLNSLGKKEDSKE